MALKLQSALQIPCHPRTSLMKTIAYLTPAFPVLSETFVGTEMRAMARRGHRIVPIAFRRHPGPAQSADAKLSASAWYMEDLGFSDALSGMAHLKPSFWKGLKFALRQKGMSTRSLLYSAARLAAVAGYEKCDHIHAHFAQATAATALVAARMLGIGVSFVGHGYDVYATPSDLPLKLSHADFAVAVCGDMARDFHRLAPNAKIDVVYCGVDPDRFAPVERMVTPGQRLLFIGRLCETKGVGDLLDALALIPSDRRPSIDLVGHGPLGADLERRTDELGLRPWISFLGARSAEWVARHGPGYRALVGPFKLAENGDRDTGPVVVKEAMAMGLPVVTTDFMGCKEMVSAETGIKVPPGDPVSLAAALERVAGMRDEEVERMGRSGRRRLLNLFTADRQAQTLSALVEAV
jgi:glycosyltransferase involved in cell wall biosynthesis